MEPARNHCADRPVAPLVGSGNRQSYRAIPDYFVMQLNIDRNSYKVNEDDRPATLDNNMALSATAKACIKVCSTDGRLARHLTKPGAPSVQSIATRSELCEGPSSQT